MKPSRQILEYLKRNQALAKTGLTYARDPYDQERYEELRDSTNQLLSLLAEEPIEGITFQFQQLADNYPTPKVDVRGFVLDDDRILLVQEQADQRWAMPGGWCDIGFSPAENVQKEIQEETALPASVERLLAVWDKRNHDHPDDVNYVYKIVFHCQVNRGTPRPGHDVMDARFFPIHQLPPLSEGRNTQRQIEALAELVATGNPPLFD